MTVEHLRPIGRLFISISQLHHNLASNCVLLLQEVTCEKCGHGQAYFKEVQIRSADEPATLFFRCCKCGDIRREG